MREEFDTQSKRDKEIDVRVKLYNSGLSLRAASAGAPFSREVLRRELVSRGQIRDRLQMSAGEPVGEYRTDADWRRIVLSDIDKSGDCWLWTGSVNNMGYGLAHYKRKTGAAHRIVYKLLVGDVPDGMDCCHRCDNPLCVNPDHIFIGTRKDNMQDAARKGRTRKGEDSPNAVLTENIVRKARDRAQRGESPAKIARELGAPYKTLWMAISGSTWKHLS